MQETLHSLFTNEIFYATVSAWLIAQIIKTTINLFTNRKKITRGNKNQNIDDPGGFQDVLVNLLWKTGGMPSSHSTMVSTLTTTVAIKEGVSSTEFFIAFFFATVVVRDASGVRQAIGKLGHRFNTFVRMHNKTNPQRPLEPMKVEEGHSTSEVFVGVLLGFFIGVSAFLF